MLKNRIQLKKIEVSPETKAALEQAVAQAATAVIIAWATYATARVANSVTTLRNEIGIDTTED